MSLHQIIFKDQSVTLNFAGLFGQLKVITIFSLQNMTGFIYSWSSHYLASFYPIVRSEYRSKRTLIIYQYLYDNGKLKLKLTWKSGALFSSACQVSYYYYSSTKVLVDPNRWVDSSSRKENGKRDLFFVITIWIQVYGRRLRGNILLYPYDIYSLIYHGFFTYSSNGNIDELITEWVWNIIQLFLILICRLFFFV